MIEKLPEKFVRLMTESHGASGAKWLAELPKIIAEIEANWQIKVGDSFENLSYHFVVPCRLYSGDEAVLKIGFPEQDSPVFNEAETLKLYNGQGAVKFLNLDEERLALLLEILKPGKTLREYFRGSEEECAGIAIKVLQKIIRKPPENNNFVRLEKWFAGFERAAKTNFPAETLKKARKFYEELSNAETFLIHGDFHHENILSASREPFLVIDPKGIVGQIGYEISVFLNNHVWILKDDKDLIEKTQKVVRQFSEAFEIAPEVLKKWAYAQCTLSAWWTFEENGKNWKTDLEFAEIWEV